MTLTRFLSRSCRRAKSVIKHAQAKESNPVATCEMVQQESQDTCPLDGRQTTDKECPKISEPESTETEITAEVAPTNFDADIEPFLNFSQLITEPQLRPSKGSRSESYTYGPLMNDKTFYRIFNNMKKTGQIKTYTWDNESFSLTHPKLQMTYQKKQNRFAEKADNLPFHIPTSPGLSSVDYIDFFENVVYFKGIYSDVGVSLFELKFQLSDYEKRISDLSKMIAILEYQDDYNRKFKNNNAKKLTKMEKREFKLVIQNLTHSGKIILEELIQRVHTLADESMDLGTQFTYLNSVRHEFLNL